MSISDPLTSPLQFSNLLDSPLGTLWAAASPHGLRFFIFGVDQHTFHREAAAILQPGETLEAGPPHPVLAQAAAYLSAEQTSFTVKIAWKAFTPFQAAVYRAVLSIPFGETRTYGQIAAEIGRPRAARAVGTANGANPLPIIIPCHRLVGSDGTLRGYGGVGSLKTKRWLLDLEQRIQP